MNIIIPLCGKGERFSKDGYKEPKPLIPVFNKTMIENVLDNIETTINDKIFIIYNKIFDEYNYSNILIQKYPNIFLINLKKETSGAAETIFLGINHIFNNYQYHQKTILLDCDTFYTTDIITIFRNSTNNMVFYTKNYDINPIYSYIELDDNSNILRIEEKHKISDNANTGAYAFIDISVLHQYSKYVLENNIKYKNEPYTSCVINIMLNDNIRFIGNELKSENVFSLGTPNNLKKYINKTHAFMFDLDGTLVLTDDIYYEVWSIILNKYNIVLTDDIFKKYIQGNNDKHVINTLLKDIQNIKLTELSNLKDELFIKHIDKIKVIDGVYIILQIIKERGHKCCIVTNCNRTVSDKIIKHINIEKYIDFIICGDECKIGKPNPEPYTNAINKFKISNNKCIIFEDSKTGLLSGKSVNPKQLIGIETIYDSFELNKYGVNASIKNYNNFDIEQNIETENTDINNIKNMILNSVNIQVVDVIIDENKYKGGFIADVIGIIVKTEDIDYDCVLKYENTNITNLSFMANKLDLYEREYYFYEEISKSINIKIPKFIGLMKDDNYKNKGILLENLSTKNNFQLNLNLNNENIDVSLKIIDNMAKFHSKYWNKKLSLMFPKLKRNNDTTFCPFFKNFISERKAEFKEKWNNILSIDNLKKYDEIINDFENIQERLSNNNTTFIHGDIKSPNIFYDRNNNDEPYFLDWQHCAIGKGVQDLVFFIIESFDISNIHLLFPLFKNYYYKKLLEYNIKNYSFAEYENDMYDALCYIPMFTAIWFGTVPNDELIDKNFPFFFIQKLFSLLQITETK